MKNKEKIYVVTYWDEYTDPVVTVFDNHDAADKCFRHFNELHEGCCLDSCEVYNLFENGESKRIFTYTDLDGGMYSHTGQW